MTRYSTRVAVKCCWVNTPTHESSNGLRRTSRPRHCEVSEPVEGKSSELKRPCESEYFLWTALALLDVYSSKLSAVPGSAQESGFSCSRSWEEDHREKTLRGAAASRAMK